MFGLGPSELVIVGVIAILLFGKKLPEVAKSLGGSYTQFRRGIHDIQSELNVNSYDYEDNSNYLVSSSGTKTADDNDDDEPAGPRFEPPPAEQPPEVDS